jgi:hypothetical protein
MMTHLTVRPFVPYLIIILIVAGGLVACGSQHTGLTVVADPQTAQGRVSGFVRGPTGEVVPGVSLTLEVKKCLCEKCPDPKACDCCPPRRSLTTDDTGRYEFALPPGTYTLSAKKGDSEVRLDIEIQDAGDLKQDVTLPREQD